MSNEEAAAFYVARAKSHLERGELARASHLFHTAALHDPSNAAARDGAASADRMLEEARHSAIFSPGPSTSRPRSRRRRRRPWWRRLLGVA